MDIYQLITDKIIAQIDAGVCPWTKPWSGVLEGAINYETRKPYSLLNQMLLQKDGEWLTFNQVQKRGGKIRKGAKSGMVVFTKRVEYKKEVISDEGEVTEKVIHIPMLKYYNVFHISDCEGIDTKIKEEDNKVVEPLKEGEKVISTYLANNPHLKFEARKSNRAYYAPFSDSVVVPTINQYSSNPEEYYSTTFHELGHSTMRFDRCDRKDGASMMKEEYSREELVAELCAAMLCAITGMTSEKRLQNSAAYLKGWASKLKEDTKAIVWASTRAEAAAKYILYNQKPSTTKSEEK